jgi:XTP/dITP diphosphohydrolase
MADDSGLEVEALGGSPGVHSRRFSPLPDATDADRRKLLLNALTAHARPWSARFCCSVAIATPDGKLHQAEGSCRGEIIPEERGKGGFGYDPIFLISEIGRTMAELSMAEKNQLSHRARRGRSACAEVLLPLGGQLTPLETVYWLRPMWAASEQPG